MSTSVCSDERSREVLGRGRRLSGRRAACRGPGGLARQHARGCSATCASRARRKGGGGLGRPRYVAIAKWRGGRIVREAKALVPSAWDWAHWRWSRPRRAMELARGAYRSPGPALARWRTASSSGGVAADSRKIESRRPCRRGAARQGAASHGVRSRRDPCRRQPTAAQDLGCISMRCRATGCAKTPANARPRWRPTSVHGAYRRAAGSDDSGDARGVARAGRRCYPLTAPAVSPWTR